MAWARDVAAQSHRAVRNSTSSPIATLGFRPHGGFAPARRPSRPPRSPRQGVSRQCGRHRGAVQGRGPSRGTGDGDRGRCGTRRRLRGNRARRVAAGRQSGAEDRPDGRRRTIEPANRAAKEFHSQARLEAGGTAEVRFELPALPEGLWQGEVKAEIQDDLAFDNQCPVAFLIAPPLGVLVVDGPPGASPVASETYFLETAIGLADHDPGPSAGPFAAVTVPYDPAAGLPDLRNKTSLVV